MEENLILNYILDEIDGDLVEHISFKKELIGLLKFVFATAQSDSSIIPYISENKREVSLSNSGMNRENKLVVRGSIIIEKDGSLTTNKYSGIVYDEVDGEYKSILYTYYYQEHINRFGVSLSKTAFTDEFKLKENKEDVPIKQYVFSTIHRPIMYYGRLFAYPLLYMNASLTHIYRKPDEPGLIFTDVISNLKQNRELLKVVNKQIFLSNPKNPRDLSFILTPVAIFDELTKNYKKKETV